MLVIERLKAANDALGKSLRLLADSAEKQWIKFYDLSNENARLKALIARQRDALGAWIELAKAHNIQNLPAGAHNTYMDSFVGVDPQREYGGES